MKLLETDTQVQLEPVNKAELVIIWLHGLGADGYDFVPVVPLLELSAETAIRYIFPHAPVQPVTVNNGWPMRAWYDILAMGASREIDHATLQISVQRLVGIIDSQISEGIAAENILLIGFSQGGALAYETALSYPQSLAGVAALSTYLAKPPVLPLKVSEQFPVYIAHGSEDQVVGKHLGLQAFQALSALGLAPTWEEYEMGHEVIPQQLEKLGHWIDQILIQRTES